MKDLFKLSPPGINSTGTLSAKDWAAPGKEFSAPGPPCIANTPICFPPVDLLIPSAIATPILSCLHIIGFILIFAQDSINGVDGKQLKKFIFSFFNISANNSDPFIC